jgi:hypothetical protein
LNRQWADQELSGFRKKQGEMGMVYPLSPDSFYRVKSNDIPKKEKALLA